MMKETRLPNGLYIVTERPKEPPRRLQDFPRYSPEECPENHDKTHWLDYKGKEGDDYLYVCRKCGTSITSKSEREQFT